MSDADSGQQSAPDPGEEAITTRKTRNKALALPLAGLALVTSPALGLFATDARVLGVPLIALYIFTIWLCLIACAYFLSRRLDGDG